MSVAVVTGAGRGLGRAIAHRLAGGGDTVACLDVDEKAARAVAGEGGGTAHRCDVTSAAELREVAGALGDVDALVSNAGIWRFGPLLEMTPDDAEAVLRVNLLGTVFAAQAFVPGMASRRRGAIVNLSS